MKTFMFTILMLLFLTGCMTNKRTYSIEDNDYWNERYYKES